MSELGLDSMRRALPKERAAIAVLLLTLYAAGYFAVGLSTDPQRARSLASALDDRIPFVPEAIYLYAWVYTALAFPLFAVRSPALFRRVALAYASAILVSLLAFRFYPVTAIGLRPDVDALDTSRFAEWGVKLVFGVDPPMNLFPSLHLTIATLAALSAWKARPIYGALGCLWAVLIAASICAVKQHFLVDGLAGFALALACYAVFLRPYERRSVQESAYGWRGPLLYLLFHGLVYLTAYAVFRTGLEPAG